MGKVTSKLQLTVPKVIADEYRIRPGDELQWVAAGEVIRIVPASRRRGAERALSVEERLKLFDQATERQRQRGAVMPGEKVKTDKRANRGWNREDLYTRGFPR